MIEAQPPIKPTWQKRIFLAGSIEQGKATNWQKLIIDEFSDRDVVFLNPRRDHWNPDLKQELAEPEFVTQVLWELDMLEAADIIAMYLEPGTLSPISLLEFGAFCKSGKLVVCCPDGFWRKGNIEVMCARHNIALLPNFAAFIYAIDSRL